MRKILVPIDGSKPAIHALEFLARRRRAGEQFDVQILYVEPALVPTAYTSAGTVKKWLEQRRKKVFENPKVNSLQERLEADVVVKVGDIAATILDFARRSGQDEIVMGTRGMGPIKGLVLGSNANKVAQLSSIPVTLVK